MSEAMVPYKGDIIESVIVKGDLAKLTPAERTAYYKATCESLGLNPLTRPFEYIELNKKLTLYARKDATEQLRKINKVSLVGKPQFEFQDDVVIVSVSVEDATGRTDADIGVVSIANLRGDAKANALMKAVTKAKRRATLSICGLGFLDESEIETIPDARPFVEDVSFEEQMASGDGQDWPPEPPVYDEAKGAGKWDHLSDEDFTVPDFFDPYDQDAFERACNVKVTFGKKHNGDLLGDIYNDDPGYLRWLTSEYEPKDAKSEKLRNAAAFLRAYRRWEESQDLGGDEIPEDLRMPEDA